MFFFLGGGGGVSGKYAFVYHKNISIYPCGVAG